MAYNRLNLKNGDVLEAEDIEHLEDGIEGEIIELDQNSDLGEFVYAEDNITETSVAAHYVYSVDGEYEDTICRYIGKAQPRTDDEVGFRFLDAKHIRIVTVWFKNGDSAQELEFTPLSMSGHSITLGLHTDGLLYVFIDDVPVGNGIALPSGGASGDVVGNIDSGNNIILSGNLPDGTYTIKYEMEDGRIIDIGPLEKDTSVTEFDNGLFNPSMAKLNYRLNSSNAEEEANGVFYTQDYIPVTSANEYFCIKGCTVSDENVMPHSVCNILYYDINKAFKGRVEIMRTYSAMKNIETVDATNLIYKFYTCVDYANKALSYASDIAFARLVLTTNAKGDRTRLTSSDIEKIVIKLDEIIS